MVYQILKRLCFKFLNTFKFQLLTLEEFQICITAYLRNRFCRLYNKYNSILLHSRNTVFLFYFNCYSFEKIYIIINCESCWVSDLVPIQNWSGSICQIWRSFHIKRHVPRNMNPLRKKFLRNRCNGRGSWQLPSEEACWMHRKTIR